MGTRDTSFMHVATFGQRRRFRGGTNRQAGGRRPRWQFVHNFVVGFLTIMAAVVVTVSFAAPQEAEAAPDDAAIVLGEYRMMDTPEYRTLLDNAVRAMLIADGSSDPSAGEIGNLIGLMTFDPDLRTQLDPYFAVELYTAIFAVDKTPAQAAFHAEFQQYYGETQVDIARRTLQAWEDYINPGILTPEYGPCCTLGILTDTGPTFDGFVPPNNAIGLGPNGADAMASFVLPVLDATAPEVAAYFDQLGYVTDGDDAAAALAGAGIGAGAAAVLYGSMGALAASAAASQIAATAVVTTETIVAYGQMATITTTIAGQTSITAASVGSGMAMSALIVMPMLIAGGMKIADMVQREQFLDTLNDAIDNPDYTPDFTGIAGLKTEYLDGLWYEPCLAGYEAVVTRCYVSSCPPGYELAALNCTQYADSIDKDVYDRGIGTAPTECPSGRYYENGLCYRPCLPGYTSDGATLCYRDCPSGYTTVSLLHCGKELSQSCPAGFAETILLCERPVLSRGIGEIPTACAAGLEYLDGLCYTVCLPGYSPSVTRCIEDLTCPAGYDSLLLTCFRSFDTFVRDSYDRGAGSPISPEDETVQANLAVIFAILLKRIIADPADLGTPLNPVDPPIVLYRVPTPNVAPEMTASGGGAAEGLPSVIDFVFRDSNSGDSHTATVNWGDGTPTETITPLDNPKRISHVYNDNGTYSATVTLSDQAGATIERSLTLVVANAAPQLSLSTSALTVNEGAPAMLSASLSDAAGDTHTATVDWGDGLGPVAVAPAALSSLSHVYPNEGSFTVTVRATDDDGASAVATASVTVDDVPPNVILQPIAAIDEGGFATASASFTDPGTIDAHTATVDWGEGNGFEAAAGGLSGLQHQFRQNGTYTVTVRVSDTRGPSGQAAQQVTVRNVAPSVSASIAPIQEGGTATLVASFTDPGLDDTHTATVDWGGAGGVQAVPVAQLGGLTHVYGENGSYTVTLTVTDSDGASTTATAAAVVANVNPVVTVLGDQIDEGETATITASFTDPGVDDTHTGTVDWGEGNGPEPLPGPLPYLDHVYSTPGTYTVTVAITDDDGGVGTGSSTVSVGAIAPIVTVDGDQIPEGGTATVEASFTDAGSATSHTATVDWGEGDGPTQVAVGDLAAMSHTYAEDGTYTVTVTVTSNNEAVGSATTSVEVSNEAPTVTVTGTTADEGAEANVSASFTDAGVDDTHTATVDWGDGAGPVAVDLTDLASLTHTYADDGTYTVTVEVTDDDNGVGSSTASVVVTDVVAVVTVVGDAIDEGGTANVSAAFTDPGDDTHTASIDWGDGSNAEPVDLGDLASMTHTYADDGTYTVTVIIADDAGPAGSMTADVVVSNVAPTVAAADATIDEGDAATIVASFGDIGVLDTHTATVDWGDGSEVETVDVSTLDVLSHIYIDDGAFTVMVTVTDNAGDSGSATATVEVANVVPTLTVPDVTVDEGAVVTLRPTSNDPGGNDLFRATVDWGDGTDIEEVDGADLGELSHTYADDGTYTVTITLIELERPTSVSADTFRAAVESAQSRSVTLTVTVSSVAPTVDVASEVARDGRSATIEIGISDGAGDTHTATIDWGDGDGPVAIDPASGGTLGHTYDADGTYTVTVVVTDDDGETTTTTTEIVVDSGQQTTDPTTTVPTDIGSDDPTVPTTPTPAGDDSPTIPSTELPQTGQQMQQLLWVALLALLVGLFILMVARRRSASLGTTVR